MSSSYQLINTITELVNIGAGKAAEAMNQLFGSHIRLVIPRVDTITESYSREDIIPIPLGNFIEVQMNFNGNVSGNAAMYYPKADVPLLITALVGTSDDGSEEYVATKNSVLKEVTNIAVNAIIGSISNIIKTQVFYSVPILEENLSTPIDSTSNEKFCIQASTDFGFEKISVISLVIIRFENKIFLENFMSTIE